MVVGDWLVESQLNQLRRGTEATRLEPRSMEVLQVLLRHPGEVLAKDRLLGAVWGDQVISEEALTHAVWELRKALGDDARKPSYIQTIPKRGYRLIAAVCRPESRAAPRALSLFDAAGAAPEPAPASEPEQADARPESTKIRPGLIVRRLWLPALAAIVLGYWGTDRLRRPAPGAVERPRILVRPFEVTAGDGQSSAKTERFVAGITSEITRRLVAFDGLAVVPRDTAGRYADRPLDEIHDDGIGIYVLDGQIETKTGAPEGLRIAPQLIHLGDDRIILSLDETVTVAELPGMYTRIALEIAAELIPPEMDSGVELDAYRSYLSGLESRSLPRFETESQRRKRMPTAADQAFRQGLALKSFVDYERESLSRAADLFAHAVRQMPTFAAAWAELAKAQVYIYFNGHGDRESLQSARAALEQARRLAPDAAQVRIAESLLAYYGEQDYGRAFELLSPVASQRTNDAEVLRILGYLHRRLGNLNQAVELFERALELEPRDSSVWSHLAETLRAQRRFEKAAASYERAMDLNPSDPVARGEAALNQFAGTGSIATATDLLASFPHPHDKRILYYRLSLDLYGRQFQRAKLRFAEAPSVQDPLQRFNISWLAALAYQRLGRGDDARLLVDEIRQFMEEQVERTPRFSFYRGYLALTYAYLGRDEDARKEIGAALELKQKDHFSGPRFREMEARVLALLGDLEASFAQLEDLLHRDYQHCLTLRELEADPFWDSWRQDPRFPADVESPANPGRE